MIAAAGVLFAKDGYEGTTLRQITRVAKVNLAAVNYHHGDKQALYLEVLKRALEPVIELQLTRLRAAEQEAGEHPVPIPVIFGILSGPLFESAGATRSTRHAARLIGRSLTEPAAFLEKFLEDEFQPLLARFAQALRRHDPACPPQDFLWRYNFIIGAMMHTLATLHRMGTLTRGICRDHDHATALSRFVHFATRAFDPTHELSTSPPDTMLNARS